MARNLLESIELLASASRCSPRSASTGSRRTASGTSATPSARSRAATALNPYIGYDKASEIVKEAPRRGRSLREVAREAGVDEASSTRRSTTTRWPKPHG
jgi:fumarate hydratase class II